MNRPFLAGALALVLFLVGSAIGIATAAGPTATQNGTCQIRDRLLAYLKETYRERPHALGTINEKGAVEVLLSESGSFSIIFTYANGVSCLVAAGQGWHDAPASIQSAPY